MILILLAVVSLLLRNGLTIQGADDLVRTGEPAEHGPEAREPQPLRAACEQSDFLPNFLPVALEPDCRRTASRLGGFGSAELLQ